MSEQREYLSVRQVADELQVDEQTVRRWIQQPDGLSAYRPGRFYRILRKDLQEFLVRQTATATHPVTPPPE